MADLDDYSDILGQTVEEVEQQLRFRDDIIEHKLIEDLVVPADTVDGQKNREKLVHMNESRSSTVMERVSCVFWHDRALGESELSKKGRMAMTLPLFIGGIVGSTVGFMKAFTSYDEYVRSNTLTIWRTPELAKRHIVDFVHLKFLTSTFTTGIRVTFFTSGCYVLPLLFTAAYGKTSFWEYAAGWGLTSSLYCLNRGLIPMLAAGSVAAIPGLIYGTINMFAARQLGQTFEQLYAKESHNKFFRR